MQVTQSYARPSSVASRGDGLGFAMAAELTRPPVRLEALVHHSTSYGRVMLALHRVVSSHAGFEEKDHTAYQEWVQARYLEELPTVLNEMGRQLPQLNEELAVLREQLAPLREQENQLSEQLFKSSGRLLSLYGAGKGISNRGQPRRRYWKYLYQHHIEQWIILDPVVSVHPDVVLFEVFSRDESSYGCVRVPMENLESFGETVYGTTNVDYSRALANEMYRVRDYRPAFLGVGGDGVSVQTSAGTRVEKKIDLPPSWVRGFLQVQSASSLPVTSITLSATTTGEILRRLKARREQGGPRSLKFHLTDGEYPVVEIEPWGERVTDGEHRYNGENVEIRIWGRRRLFVLEEMLPHASSVEVRLLGTGLPSFWSVELEGHRFELGLSGWTENDWSRSARFDLLASSGEVPAAEIEVAASHLESALRLAPADLVACSDLSRLAGTRALQGLCRQGRAMFDAIAGVYRWRQLLPFAAPLDEEDTKSRSARRWLEAGQVDVIALNNEELKADEFLHRVAERGAQLYRAAVTTEGGLFHPVVGLDTDGRATFSQCTCGAWRRDKGRTGPCGHILACLMAVVRADGMEQSFGQNVEASL